MPFESRVDIQVRRSMATLHMTSHLRHGLSLCHLGKGRFERISASSAKRPPGQVGDGAIRWHVCLLDRSRQPSGRHRWGGMSKFVTNGANEVDEVELSVFLEQLARAEAAGGAGTG